LNALLFARTGLATQVVTTDSGNPLVCDDIGTHDITFTVTDQNGNSASCTTIVNVVDNLAPTFDSSDRDINLDSSCSFATATGTGGSYFLFIFIYF